MDRLDREELKKLVRRREGWSVSIYMPAHRVFPEIKQDPIRFKNLLRQAEDRLKEGGVRAPEAKRMLKPARALIKDNFFWRYQSDGLAAFVSSEEFIRYRLPLKFGELLVVTDRFHIKPLLPLFVHEGRFFILALSQNEVRFFHCTRYDVSEVMVSGVPRSLGEALKSDQPEKQLQFHTRTPPGVGERAAIFHGHGVGTDDAKDNILRFFQQVDRGLLSLLVRDQVPLVLAGVDYLFAIYREANSYQHLMEEGISGNPEGLRPEELHAHAWKIVEPYFLKGRDETISQYRQLAGSGRTSTSIEEIARAAFDGKVDTLLLSSGFRQWGTFDSETRTVRFHEEPGPGDEDLLDLAAVHTFMNGGTVYALEPEKIPDGRPVAAVFRY